MCSHWRNAWDETPAHSICPDNYNGVSIHDEIAAPKWVQSRVGNFMSELAPRLKTLANIELDSAPLVGIIMGSDSDLPTMKQAAIGLRDFDIPL